jgi:hypothetical protein
MHRRTLLVALTVGALAVLGAFASVSTASPTLAGAGTRATHAAARYTPPTSVGFEAEYDAAAYYGPVKCHGKHQTNEKAGYPGNETEGGRDVETCRSTTGKPLTNVTPGETGTEFPGSSEWESDYFYFVKGLSVRTTNVSYTVSANGKQFKLAAVYPFA